MNKHIDMNKLERSVQRHTFLDGVMEWMLGLWLLALGGYYLLDAGSNRTFFFLYPLLLILLPVLLGPITQFVKARVTFPRIGYAKFPPAPVRRQRRWMALILASVGLLLGVILGFYWAARQGGVAATGLEDWLSLMPLALGAMLAASFFYTAVRYGISRFYIVGGLVFIAGAVVTMLSLPLMMRIIAFSSAAGALLLLSGLVTFVIFLRRYPVYESGMDEERP